MHHVQPNHRDAGETQATTRLLNVQTSDCSASKARKITHHATTSNVESAAVAAAQLVAAHRRPVDHEATATAAAAAAAAASNFDQARTVVSLRPFEDGEEA